MNKQTDISIQIQKYLTGKLDAKAMHQLEREALNDPFLADALEGYAGAKANQQDNFNDIATRLQTRTQAKVKRLIPWKFISVAASVIVVLTIGGLWMFNNNGKPQIQLEKTAMLDKVEVVKPDTQATAKAPSPVAEMEQDIVSAPPIAQQRAAAVRIPSTLKQPDRNAEITANEPQVVADKARQNSSKAKQSDVPALTEISANNAGYTTVKRKDSVTLEDRIVNGFFNIDIDKPQAIAAARPIEQALKGRVDGVSVTKIGKSIMPNQFIDGRVMDNGMPLPGVTVKVKGTGIIAQTDANGKFKIPANKEKTELEVAYVGYLTQAIEVKKQDSLMIAMEPNKQSLNEVVVVAYGSKKRVGKALPAIGWKEYKTYLNENATSPDGKKGTVKLSFTVTVQGELKDFKILNSVSAETDAEAIDLVKDGPNWLSNTNGKPEVVTLSIKFTP